MVIFDTSCSKLLSLQADVVCKQLGYPNVREVTTESRFGDVTEKFAFDEVSCTGQEESLQQCYYEDTNDCRPAEAAGVVCHEKDQGEHERNTAILWPSC